MTDGAPTVVTRFAPSPTGPLHLGHAYAAQVAHDLAARQGGWCLLRIEDIDRQRAKPEWEQALMEDLRWLGLGWEGPVLRQSNRMDAYHAALSRLWDMGLLYPCTCTRRDIAEALSAPQEGAPLTGPDGPVYPGTCRPSAPLPGPRSEGAHLRLDIARALSHAGLEEIAFDETGSGPAGETGRVSVPADHLTRAIGDVVLARRDFGTSYHLSVVVDDAAQGITHVTRGRDLFEATAIHVLLQHLLELPIPTYHHHALVRDAQGKRLAKRDDARAIRLYREQGLSAAEVLHRAAAQAR